MIVGIARTFLQTVRPDPLCQAAAAITLPSPKIDLVGSIREDALMVVQAKTHERITHEPTVYLLVWLNKRRFGHFLHAAS